MPQTPPPTVDEMLTKVRNLALNVQFGTFATPATALQLARRFRQLDEMLSSGQRPADWGA